MAQLSSGSSEGIVAAGAVHAVSFNLPAAVENSKTDANDKMDENHETMEICPVGEEQDAEEPQLVSNVVPDLTSGSGSASASVAASVPAVVLASGSRPAGSMPALRGSGSGFRVSKALRSRGLAVPRRGCRVAHRRRKLFRRPERAHRYDPEIVALRGTRHDIASTDLAISRITCSRRARDLLDIQNAGEGVCL